LREIFNTVVYLTHYGWDNLDELKVTADELGYKVLAEGPLNL
jgi:hypothetical protein